ncbi:MAG: hypothetical protein K1W25_16725 [Lachnospiraceae bacterium]
MAYYLKDLPFTEEGKKLKLSDEDRERFRLVYKKKDDQWVLHNIYEKGGEYGDDCIVVPLESTYKGNIELAPGTEFANVVGTSNDPKPGDINTSWIAFWKCIYIATHYSYPPSWCCTDGMKYNNYGNNIVLHVEGATYGELNGGHIILGRIARQPYPGEIVYIVPICTGHNTMGNSFYMKTGHEATFAVALSNVVTNIHNYLARHPLEAHEKI